MKTLKALSALALLAGFLSVTSPLRADDKKPKS